jgi:general secretion pathway protein D
MIIVDVVMVGTEENITTRKGVNLLNGLTLQFGNGEIPGFRWEDINIDAKYSEDGSFTDLGGNSPTAGNILASTITIPALSYSLNIFNSHSDRAEILARPTLVALSGQQSEFFSGLHISAAAVASGSIGGESVTINEDIGVKLVVTPELLEDGRVRLVVNAERTFLKTPSQDIVFENKVETTKTNVLANVEMRMGETLILSGLSEKETERLRDGVPGLQDLPILQYFFAQKNTRDFQRSVLVLLTPRVPQYVYHEAGRGRGATGDSRALTELQARYSDWFKPYPNWASVFHHMQSNSLYREFRTGDVTLERWENQETLSRRLSQALRFLYF